jgi:hypothetical protein
MIVGLLLIAMSAGAQDAAKKKADEDATMAYYVDAAKTVVEHARIAELSGPWKVTTKLWFDPSGEPQTSSGTGSGKLILGGRFLEMTTDTKGAFDSESLTIYGFDRRTSEYTMVGFDTLGTYSITAAGKHDEAQKGVVLQGSYAQPPNMQQQKYHFVWTKPSDKEHLFTLYFAIDGKDVRVAETRFTR